MKKRYFYLPGFVLLLFSQLLSAQGLVSVNNFTGTANVVIPLYNVTSGSLNVPVTAMYSGGGVKVKDVEGNAGMGWNISAGGGVYRMVRGLPDDCKKDSAGNDRKGWLYNTNASKIGLFTILNTVSPPNCTYETTDISYISSNFSDLSDTEPDVYNVSAPGLSCQLYIDGSGAFKISPYRDYKITPAYDGTTGAIVSFTIVNGQGTVYVFSTVESEKKRLAIKSTDSLKYFKLDYNQYRYSITYNTAWKLTSVTDISGNAVLFDYGDLTTFRSTPIKLETNAYGIAFTQFDIVENMTTKALSDISTSDRNASVRTMVTFNYTNYTRVGSVISSIEGYNQVKKFIYVDANKRGDGRYGREFLRQINTGDQQYTFSYKGLSNSVANPRISLPDSATYKIDYWGYYNGSSETKLLPKININPSNTALERYRNMGSGANSFYYTFHVNGADRRANVDSVQIGTLNDIAYSRGGHTSLLYESNSYYDGTADSVIYGGGIRIKQIKDFDGINSTAVNEVNYSYDNPSGTTSGKPVAVPVYQFTTPYNGPGTSQIQWEYSTVRSEVDLSPEDKSIIYGYVTVSSPGAGKTVYEYTTPATQWNASLPSDWAPTKTYVARTDCSLTNFCTSDVNTYPFPDNPNYDFERGLLTKATAYNEDTHAVSETAYTYTRTSTPTTINALKFDDNLNDVAYAKYKIYVNTGELTSTVTTKVYDLNSTALYKQNSVAYSYDGTVHKLMTKKQTTGSDGTINITRIKYVMDYFTSTGSDTVNKAIYNLQLLNCNIPIETWMQTQRDSVRTVSASLVKFKTFTFSGYADQYLPNHVLQFVSARGVTDFTPSNILFGVFSSDSRYVVKENDVNYSALGYLETADDNNRNISTRLTDPAVSQTVAAFANARIKEIGFSNFDSALPDAGFGGDYSSLTTGHTGYGIFMGPEHDQYRTFSKKANVSNYIFSAWLRPTANGHATISLVDNATSTYHNYTLNFTASDKYAYYQIKLPLTDMGSTFKVTLSVSVNASVDDLMIYPENAQAATIAIDGNTQNKIAETNTNGKSVYYQYDEFNRLKRVYDNDGMMVQHKSYVTRNGSDPAGLGTVTLAASADDMTGNFAAGVPAADDQEGLKYSWNFGDSPTYTDGSAVINHVYASTGTYTVTLVVSSPFYPSQTITTSIVINGTSPSHFFHVSGASREDGTADISQVNFYDGTTLKYSFSQGELTSGTGLVPSGTYTIKVIVSGQSYNAGLGTGYQAIGVSKNGTQVDCAAYIMGKVVTYTFSMDLTSASVNYLDFQPLQIACP